MQSIPNPLVVFYTDDDPDDRELFKEIVEEMLGEHQLLLLADGDELADALTNPPPDPHLVFLDLNMPRKNGFDILREMRSNNKHLQTPVILFTTSGDEQNIAKAKELGANMFITKPRSYQQYKQTLSEVLAKDWRNPSQRTQDFESRTK